MNTNLVNEITASQLKKDVPHFSTGDTLAVSVSGISESFIVRKTSGGVGVERTFFLHSPTIAKIDVKRKGKVRRHKIYFLRKRSGKAARLKEVL